MLPTICYLLFPRFISRSSKMIGIAAIFGRNFQVGRQLPTFPELFGPAAECIDAGDQGLVFQSKQLIITGDYCMVKPSFARSQYCIDDIVYRRHPFGPMTSRANSKECSSFEVHKETVRNMIGSALQFVRAGMYASEGIFSSYCAFETGHLASTIKFLVS